MTNDEWMKRSQLAIEKRKEEAIRAFANVASRFFPNISYVEDMKWQTSVFGKKVYFELKSTNKMGELRQLKLVRIDFDWVNKPAQLGSVAGDAKHIYQARTLQFDSVKFLELMESFIAELKKEGYKVEAKGADPKRERLYQAMFQRSGWQQYAPSKYENFREFLENS